jgi:hypothetical protein
VTRAVERVTLSAVVLAARRHFGPNGLWPSLLLSGAMACGSDAEIAALPDLPPATPGYPAYTSGLTLRISRIATKQCHATLVAPGWAITAAHCFSEVSPEGRGRLANFDRGFATSAVVFHPRAHVSGSTRLDDVWHNEDFIAAHDLALIPIEPVDLPNPGALWSEAPTCEAIDLRSVPARLGRLSGSGQPETAAGVVLDTRAARSLLGPGQQGDLLALRSDGALPGDSGSGVAVSADDLAAATSGCLPPDSTGGDVLVGVLQDANPLNPSAPLGVTPIFGHEHSSWLAATLEGPSPLPDPNERPVLDQPCLPGDPTCS